MVKINKGVPIICFLVSLILAVGLFSAIVLTQESSSQEEVQSQIEEFKKVSKIEEPSDDKPSGPGLPLIVKGKSGKIPSGYHMWIVVHPVLSSGYWPQGGELYPSPRDNSWEVTAWLGEREKGLNEPYQIILLLANEEVHKEFVEYLEKGPTEGYPERPLPKGVEQIDRVTYTRTK